MAPDVGVMTSDASPEAKEAVLTACDARVGTAAVAGLADKLAARMAAAMPSTDAYVVVLTAALVAGGMVARHP